MTKETLSFVFMYPLYIIDRVIDIGKLVVVCYIVETSQSVIIVGLRTLENSLMILDHTADTAATTVQAGFFVNLMGTLWNFF
jgi:hypothetical protein